MQQLLKIVDKVERANHYLSAAIEAIGIVALLLIMFITCADVIGAKMFLRPVPGALDIVMLAQAVAVSFGVAAALIAGRHVSVEIFLMHMPPLLKRITTIAIELLALALFVLIVWRLAVYGHELQIDGEVSPTARIPVYPFAYGIALAAIPACIELFTRVINAILGKDA